MEARKVVDRHVIGGDCVELSRHQGVHLLGDLLLVLGVSWPWGAGRGEGRGGVLGRARGAGCRGCGSDGAWGEGSGGSPAAPAVRFAGCQLRRAL